MSDILVYTEQIDNEITDVSLQCLTKAKEIASGSMKISALSIGSAIKDKAQGLSQYGAEKILYAEDDILKTYFATPYKKILQKAIELESPQLILFPASTQGNDLASAISTQVGAGCVLDCKEIEFNSGKFTAKRVEFDNKVKTNFSAGDGKMLIVSCKDGITDAHQGSGNDAEMISIPVEIDDSQKLTQLLRNEIAKKTVNLKAAKIIVTAGAGIGSKENLKLIEDLAQAIGAEVGATRPVVDAGWASADRQVGQTGSTVKPDLYITCGVSGAVQHRVGMMESKKIVAINSDSSAPIFKIANYAIVADLNVVIPKIIKLLNKQ